MPRDETLTACPSGSEYVKGTNIALTLGSSDADEIRRLYAALSDGGEVQMELGKTFFQRAVRNGYRQGQYYMAAKSDQI